MDKVSWLEVSGNPFLTNPHPRMLLPQSYYVVKTTKLRTALKGIRSEKTAYSISYDENYIVRWLQSNLSAFHLNDEEIESIVLILKNKLSSEGSENEEKHV